MTSFRLPICICVPGIWGKPQIRGVLTYASGSVSKLSKRETTRAIYMSSADRTYPSLSAAVWDRSYEVSGRFRLYSHTSDANVNVQTHFLRILYIFSLTAVGRTLWRSRMRAIEINTSYVCGNENCSRCKRLTASPRTTECLTNRIRPRYCIVHAFLYIQIA